MITTGPRALKNSTELRERVAAVHAEPRVQPLNAWVAALQEELGDGCAVPWFDPASGGIEARILFLLEAPGQKSVGEKAALSKRGSGIISADNDDVTAKNCWELRQEAGLDYQQVVHWNVVPWYLGTADRIAAPGRSDLDRALPYLHQAIGLLPRLEVVVLMGRKAQDGWANYSRRFPHELLAIQTWHPSPRVLNTNPSARSDLLRALRDAKGSLLPLG